MYPDLWKIISDRDLISDEEIWALRYWLRRELVEFARKRLRGQFTRIGEGAKVFEKILSPDALTIGFARRFATYKRAPLIFSDLARAIAIFNDPKQPVQLVFAGKAHPRDDRGKEFIQRIHEITRRNEFFGKVIFLENYDIHVARYLISGSGCLAEHAAPAPGSQRHQRPESECSWGAQSERAGRLVAGRV